MTCDVRFIDTMYLICYSYSCIVESIELIIPLNLHVPIPTQNITYTHIKIDTCTSLYVRLVYILTSPVKFLYRNIAEFSLSKSSIGE